MLTANETEWDEFQPPQGWAEKLPLFKEDGTCSATFGWMHQVGATHSCALMDRHEGDHVWLMSARAAQALMTPGYSLPVHTGHVTPPLSQRDLAQLLALDAEAAQLAERLIRERDEAA